MYGLLGEHLPHSFSPQIHKALGNPNYALFEKTPDEIENFLKEKSFKGINVTIPYKKAVIPFLDMISQEAEKIGAVNTIAVRNGKLYGDNTDYFGFAYMVEKSGIVIENKKCLVLGNGGASLTVQAVLKDKEAKEVVVISRKTENNYDNIYNHFDSEIIVNTTPVGMYPNNLQSLVNLDDFPNLSGVLDVVYNPLRTKIILDATERQIPNATGLSMLVAQAKKAHEIFFETNVDTSVCEKIENGLAMEMSNIVLVGMAGCGKSTVGRALAQRLNKNLVDTDEVVEKTENMSIPEIITEKGEDYFRQCEISAVCSVGKEKSQIIATGGGVVTRNENYKPLKQNGIIVFINRDADLLPTNNRPLSQMHGVKTLYEKRMPMYRQFADIEVDGNGTIDEVAERIVKELNCI